MSLKTQHQDQDQRGQEQRQEQHQDHDHECQDSRTRPRPNRAAVDHRLRPRCCHLGSYSKRSKSSPVRPLACNWYYCARFIAKPKAACAPRFSWVATSSNVGLFASMSHPQNRKYITYHYAARRGPSHGHIGNMHKNLVKIGRVVPKI